MQKWCCLKVPLRGSKCNKKRDMIKSRFDIVPKVNK